MSVPARTPSDHLRAVADLVPAVRLLDTALADRLNEARRPPRPAMPLGDHRDVLIHGAFRPGQVVIDDVGLLYLLDLDGVSRGMPLKILGVFQLPVPGKPFGSRAKISSFGELPRRYSRAMDHAGSP